MLNVSYDYYRIFYYVGRYQSFSTAAKMLGSNQPNVTKVMNKLEQQTGCTLFVRSNKGITLTEEGRLLYEHVKVAYGQLMMAENELEKAVGLENGMINIGASETALHGILISVLGVFHKDYPNVRIHLSNYNTPQALQALRQNLVDFCIITAPLDMTKDCCVTDVMEYTEKLIASEDFVYDCKMESGHSGHFTLEELAGLPLVALEEGTGTYEYYNRVFAEHGCQFSPDIQVTTSDLLLPLIENNLGIGFVPEFMIEGRQGEKKLKQLHVNVKMPARKICLVENRDRSSSIAADTLKKAILEQAGCSYGKVSGIHRGRYQEQSADGSDIYGISEKAQKHIRRIKKEGRL